VRSRQVLSKVHAWRHLAGSWLVFPASALILSCETGPYSLGWDDCPERACGPAPAQPGMCPSGDLETFSCRLDAMNGGVCAWQAHCPPARACEPAQCGAAPTATMCPSDTMGTFVCEPDASGGCSWQQRCRDPSGCDVRDCGPLPAGEVACSADTIDPWSCAPDSDLVCRWVLAEGCSLHDP